MAKSIYMVYHQVDSYQNDLTMFDGQGTIENYSDSSSNRTHQPFVVEDSKQQGYDEDEYSCNSSSDCSEPQLLDEDETTSSTSFQIQLPVFRSVESHVDALVVSKASCPCYVASRFSTLTTNCQKNQYKEKRNFTWLPHVGKTIHHTVGAYCGIPHSPPVACFEGVSRGNVRLLHRKAWLEVSDTKHRYGKHLRLYHRRWESLFSLNNDNDAMITARSNSSMSCNFFDWLDSRGMYDGNPLPEIPDCLRSRLDSDMVTYIDDRSESERYAVRVVATQHGIGRLVPSNNSSVCNSCNNSVIKTGSSGWMFVLRDNVMYVAPKVISDRECTRRFHHSSFFGGRAVQAAGIVVTDEATGCLQQILPHSGHYRPGEADVQRVLYFLLEMGVCWTTFSVDVQQFLCIDRSTAASQRQNGTTPDVCDADSNEHRMADIKKHATMKKKKVESLHLRPAVTVADFLSHKARCLQQSGIFAEIEARRI
jgi:hypothetical protein